MREREREREREKEKEREKESSGLYLCLVGLYLRLLRCVILCGIETISDKNKKCTDSNTASNGSNLSNIGTNSPSDRLTGKDRTSWPRGNKTWVHSQTQIKLNDWLLADPCPQSANHCALFWVWELTSRPCDCRLRRGFSKLFNRKSYVNLILKLIKKDILLYVFILFIDCLDV